MESAKELLHQLNDTGESITVLIRNFKKDSPTRKTYGYYQDRLARLVAEWAAFTTADRQLREIKDVPTDADYFTKGYYDYIKEMATQHIALMKETMDTLGAHTINISNPSHANHDLPSVNASQLVNERSPGASGGHDGLLNRTTGKMAALTRQLKGLQLNPQQERAYYEIKKSTIKQLWHQVEDLNDQIVEKYPDPEAVGYDIDQYIRLEQEAQSAVIQLTSELSRNPNFRSTEEVPRRSSGLPLPTITIPKFTGDYMQWTSFSDIFKRIVNDQPMSDTHKMWYLKTNVIGEAERLISHLAVTEDNYQPAWKLLEERYNNRRVIVATATHRLIDQPSGVYTINSLKRFHDTTKECLATLLNMGINVSSWDPLLINILVKKLDKSVHCLYEQSISNPKELQTMEHFLAFLENRFHTLEAMGQKEKMAPSISKTCAITAESPHNNHICQVCNGDFHPLYWCKEFQQLTPQSRCNTALKLKLCVNCFSRSHATKHCTNSGRCRKCGKKHHTLVHLEVSPTEDYAAAATTITEDQPLNPSAILVGESNERTETVGVTATDQTPYVLLGTAIVKIKANGLEMECKAILDSGSQVNLITERVVSQLRLSTKASAISISGIGQGSTKAQHRVHIALQSRLNNFATQLEAFVLPRIIAPQPAQSINTDSWTLPNNITLADPQFNRPNKIDILLGAEYYHQLLAIGQIKLAENLPILQNTILGWVVSGKVSSNNLSSTTCGVCTEDTLLAKSIERFWSLEEVEHPHRQLSPHDAQCESHFSRHTTRAQDGRFVVKLPFCKEPSSLGDSHGIAFNRFLGLERRLAKDPALKQQYTEFMTDYEARRHMTRISADSIRPSNYFIPHHCVLRPESSTTKLRVVFDASAKTTSGLSLNDILHTGPTLQSDLFPILLRFRLPRFVFTTDVEKMYRQIIVKSEDRQYQVVLWRKNPTEPISYFKLNTVTYGTRAAPYLAIRCLKQLCHDNINSYPLAANFVDKNFYVDDGLGGADTLTMALEIQQQLQDVMCKYGFTLRKWCANHPQLLHNIPESDQEVNLDLTKDDTACVKTLGLTWLPKSDQLKIKVNIQPIKTVTKRTVTSDLARLFDPLGLLSPIVVKAKMFVQELWTLNLSWDEALPAELDTRWRNFRKNLTTLENYQFHRHIFKGDLPTSIQLHVFTDASERAYGTAVYVRTLLKNGLTIVHLLCAKSRIAPTKQQTLPRLELCAAVLGAQLAAKVKTDLEWCDAPTYYWTDSTIVLAWIHSQSSSFHTFVANRIASIHETSKPDQWRHVRSEDNPADVISRGIEPQKFSQTHQWVFGPFFLSGGIEHWPPPFIPQAELAAEERKKHQVLLTTLKDDNFLYGINHRNSFKTCQRIVGYALRFIKNAKTRKDERQTQRTLTPIELHDALLIIVRTIQQYAFKEDIQQLTRNNEVKGSSPIKNLTPFLDEFKILRVGGRLDASSLSFDAKHPMLIPYNDNITRLIFEEAHREHKHCGAQALLATVRQRFWPIKGKHIARETVHKCVLCARSKPKLCQQLMGSLPETRVTPARPFINTGVDYCGPIKVHFKTRGKHPQKAYIAVFCCFVTKAIHLELVTELTTDAFIGALKRFICRRGHCLNIYSDNATNFVGARNKLSELADAVFSNEAQNKIQAECSHKSITFHFIPPRSPHFGGLWEAAVKSAKSLLVTELLEAKLTYEEMETAVIEVEAILNSRPIAPLSNDPNDEAALTPGHFLIGEPLTAQVDVTARPPSSSLCSHWDRVSAVKHKFWTRWSKEYLNELQQRHKWQTSSRNLQEGTMVIIKDNTPVMKWRMARVIKTYPGRDGIVRLVDLKTSTGITQRAVNLLAPLPIDAAEDKPVGSPLLKRTSPQDDQLPSPKRHHL